MKENETVKITATLAQIGGSRWFKIPAKTWRRLELESDKDYELTIKMAEAQQNDER